MNNSELRIEALKNLTAADSLTKFSISSEEFSYLSGWTNIAIFLFDARLYLNQSEEHSIKQKGPHLKEAKLSQGMFKAFVLEYSKCFSASGKMKVSLDVNDIYTTRPDLKLVHEQILEARNKYVAHNDDENGYDISIPMTVEDDEEIMLALTYTIVTPVGDFQSFREALDFCENQVIIKFNKKVDKLEQKLGKKISFK